MADNLPHYAHPIIGRELAIAELSALLEDSSVVTIAGAGGIGKTRLAAEVAAGLRDRQRDGAWFADLGPIADPELVPAAIAGAIGLELSPNLDPSASLIAALRPRQTLIVLDNCEHLVTHAARLTDRVASECPQVRILATSREPLAIECESVYRLPSLDDRAAFVLFVAHALEADPHFLATEANAPVIRDICRRLDGIALAIQIAAACVRTMSLTQLRSRLDGRFRLLIGDSNAALSRHKTLQATIDWSYDLLGERERAIFRNLGVFSGEFTREAAARIAADARIATDAFEIGFSALVDKSMISLAGDGGQRYRMFDSLRQYALTRLQEEGAEDLARLAHARYFEERSAQAAASFGSGSEETWLAAYAPDLDNFRAASEWARRNDVGLSARIVSNLADFWEFYNLDGEGLRRNEAVLAALERPNDPEALPVLLAIGRLALSAHVYRRSLEVGDRARAIAERAGNADFLAEARRIAGRSRYLLGLEADLGLAELRAALEHFRANGTPLAIARATRDYASALAMRDPVEGRKLLLEAASLAGSIGWPRLALHVELNLAEREFRSGNREAAAERVRSAIELLRGRRSGMQLGHALTNLASYLGVIGEYDEAERAALEAISIGRAFETSNYVAISLQSLALVAAARGDCELAGRLWGYVTAWYEGFRMEPEPTEAIVRDRLREALRGCMDEVALARAESEGRKLSEDAACALVFAAPAPAAESASAAPG